MTATTVCRPDSPESPSAAVVRRVADREGVDPGELATPLYSVVDPEALDALFRPGDADALAARGAVHFEYLGYEVRVDADGDVAVTPA
ncbi:HalOD1 output domain-containing protein [Halosimplex halobium]|uniref:HalOD1 output domain-containing protein n=1 Tax=Halosimplex halobium TaxID=3396618 RepID=UPI003F5758DD